MRASLLLCLALAAPAPVVAAEGCAVDPEAALRAVNALRAEGRSCGSRWWPAARALRWQAQLAGSTRRYAEELARRDRLDHVGEGGATLRMRLGEVGYAMRAAGENLSGGPQTLDEALADWLASPPHCENLMAPDFEEFGLACASGPGRLQRYWVLQLAAPRSSPGRSP